MPTPPPTPTALSVLVTSAVSIAFIHTLVGVDHTLPFIALGRAQGWHLRRVLGLTFLCGLAHVGSSVVLGAVGLAAGVAVSRLSWIEAWRGSASSWALIVLGTLYAGWAFARERRGHGHAHAHGHVVHVHPGGDVPHCHDADVEAPAEARRADEPPAGRRRSEPASPIPSRAPSRPVAGPDPRVVTAWSLFIVFVLGPCEPLIPLLMAPAVGLGTAATVPVVAAFTVTTVGTMLTLVALGWVGLGVVGASRLERWSNTLAGVAIALAGVAMRVFGI